MSFEVEGKLFKKLDTVQVSDRFKKRDLVLELDGPYPQVVTFQLTQDRCGILDSHTEGDTVRVFFDLRGREWTSPQGEVKYFNTLSAWKIEAASQAAAATPPLPVAPADGGAFPSASDEQSTGFDGNDDLPF